MYNEVDISLCNLRCLVCLFAFVRVCDGAKSLPFWKKKGRDDHLNDI